MEADEFREFGRLFKGFLEQVHSTPDSDRDSLIDRLRDHLGVDPHQLPVVSASFPAYDLPNVHLALDGWFSRPGREYQLVGVAGGGRGHHSLGEMLEVAARHGTFGIGSVDYGHIPISVDEELECVSFGFFLGSDGSDRYAVLLRAANPQYGQVRVQVEVLAGSREAAARLLADLPELMRERNVFRGQVVSFVEDDFGPGVGPFRFHRRPALSRVDIVLADGVLERIERQVVGVARHREALTAAGQHLRRGLLLYGPPGTGKTHTIRYLLSRLPDFTVVVLTGTSIRLIGEACGLARMLQPALVVLEDCDLVAEARDFMDGANPLLFQVLNEMDGLAEEADVAFLLTTNRVDLLEPALSQRPGRVDLAVEIPLPDAEGRAQLLRLYGPRLSLSDEVVAEVVERTDGTTASFSRELVRRAVLLAAERGASEADETDVTAAVDELLSDRDSLTRRLLGAAGEDGQHPPDWPVPAQYPSSAHGTG